MYIHIYIHIYTDKHTVHVHIYIYKYIYTCIYIHTHTHTSSSDFKLNDMQRTCSVYKDVITFREKQRKKNTSINILSGHIFPAIVSKIKLPWHFYCLQDKCIVKGFNQFHQQMAVQIWLLNRSTNIAAIQPIMWEQSI